MGSVPHYSLWRCSFERLQQPAQVPGIPAFHDHAVTEGEPGHSSEVDLAIGRGHAVSPTSTWISGNAFRSPSRAALDWAGWRCIIVEPIPLEWFSAKFTPLLRMVAGESPPYL